MDEKIIMGTRRGQIELTFNWIYVLIAGAVILLFFVGLVVKQKAVSEERLNTELVRVIESILGGAAVAEKTKNVVDTAGLADYTLYFQCEDGVSEYGIKDSSARAEDMINPLFTPAEIRATSLITWSLPYTFPFKVIDLLIISSSNTQYYVLDSSTVGAPFTIEFLNATEGFNIEWITKLEEADPGKNSPTRFIDVAGNFVQDGASVPASFQDVRDERLTAVAFVGEHQLNYFQKKGMQWKKLNAQPIPIISISPERDAAKYAALFAADGEQYRCNLRKAFTRLQYLGELYLLKISDLQQYYEPLRGSATAERCLNYLVSDEGNMQASMRTLKDRAEACHRVPRSCSDLPEAASAVSRANKKLAEEGDCIPVY